MNNIKLCISDIIYWFAGLIFKVIKLLPRNSNIWVYGAWDGKMYSDNSKYMFEYMNREHSEIKSVWITRDKQISEQVRKQGYLAYERATLLGFYYCLRASVVFVTQGRGDVFGIATAGAIIVQLWHGMGIKDVSHVLPVEKRTSKLAYNSLVHAHSNEYWMVACEEAINKYSKAFNVPRERMYITGQPKDDAFINNCDNEFIATVRQDHPGSKIVVYLPTHREFGYNNKSKEILSYENLLRVNQLLAERNIVMIFKPHFHEFKNYQGMDINMSNIVFATDPSVFGDVYEFLPSCDGMITDYSGIMLGYLTANKPMVFFPYDIEDYKKIDMGFCYEYEDVAAGPICCTWDEVVEKTDAILQKDVYLNKRSIVKNYFSPFSDGKNCERVYLTVRTLQISKSKKT